MESNTAVGTTISSLPTELLEQILGYLIDPLAYPDYYRSKCSNDDASFGSFYKCPSAGRCTFCEPNDLLSVCLVSRRFYSIARALLYDTIDLRVSSKVGRRTRKIVGRDSVILPRDNPFVVAQIEKMGGFWEFYNTGIYPGRCPDCGVTKAEVENELRSLCMEHTMTELTQAQQAIVDEASKNTRSRYKCVNHSCDEAAASDIRNGEIFVQKLSRLNRALKENPGLVRFIKHLIFPTDSWAQIIDLKIRYRIKCLNERWALISEYTDLFTAINPQDASLISISGMDDLIVASFCTVILTGPVCCGSSGTGSIDKFRQYIEYVSRELAPLIVAHLRNGRAMRKWDWTSVADKIRGSYMPPQAIDSYSYDYAGDKLTISHESSPGATSFINWHAGSRIQHLTVGTPSSDLLLTQDWRSAFLQLEHLTHLTLIMREAQAKNFLVEAVPMKTLNQLEKVEIYRVLPRGTGAELGFERSRQQKLRKEYERRVKMLEEAGAKVLIMKGE